MDLNLFRQKGREDETYAAPYECLSCKATWVGHLAHDPARPGEWRPPIHFCPACGVRFSGELRRSAATERHHELRNEASWKNHQLAEARKITYQVQTWADFRPSWHQETGYYDMRGRQDAAREWRRRLSEGSWVGERVRLVARTPRGEKVVFGPVELARGTDRDRGGG